MTGNIAPAEMASISRPWDTPDVSVSFREGYLGLLPMLHYSYSAINPVAIKSLMKAVGLPVGDLAPPAARPGRRGAGQGPAHRARAGAGRQVRFQLGPAEGGLIPAA